MLGLTLSSPAVVGAAGHAELLVVHQQTELVLAGPLAQADEPTAAQWLKGGTTVLGIRKEPVGQAGEARWLVRTDDAHPQQGWVSASDATPLRSYVSELKARAVALRSDSGTKLSSLPDLIVIQNNPAIRQAWERVAEVVAENEKLPLQERLPEPYFARAEIWASVKNYFAALQDYLTGIRYARSSGRDVASYAAYFEKLAAVAESLESNPVPAAGGEARQDWMAMARRHFSLGFSDYFAGAYFESLKHFDNCVALAPDEPHFWYFRALAHRAIGESDRARHDALLGAHFENDAYAARRLMNVRLSRVQGPDRSWLERHRAGVATFHLVGANAF